MVIVIVKVPSSSSSLRIRPGAQAWAQHRSASSSLEQRQIEPNCSRQVEAAVVAAGGNQVKAPRTLGIARNTLRRRLADESSYWTLRAASAP
ncbi:MAG: helix-turn-helix domain-containing protein [Deltaproteobacteria bacterium]|nr:helix-turn-helix domain-containing protein [Deltaproteobacteria bacterium]